jgi:hypothetical protein
MRRTAEVNQARLNTLVCDDRAEGQCECLGCVHNKNRCTARNGHSLYNMNKMVRLIAVTKDGSKPTAYLPNLIGLCQNCLAEHRKSLKERPQETEGLFDMPEAARKDTPLL